MILTPKNWGSFQHYKDRDPTWIKLHKGLLTNYEFICLPLSSRALAPMLWLLASEYKDGIIDASLDKIAFRLSMTRDDLTVALTPLIESDFFESSETIADGYQPAIPEKEIESNIEKIGKREKETREVALVAFEETFWFAWPNKVGKPAALKALRSALKRGTDFDDILAGVERYARHKPPDRPWLNPATFLNQNRWEDQPAGISTGPPVRASTVYQQRQVEGREILDEIGQSISRRSGTENPVALRHDTGNGREIVRGGPGPALIELSPKSNRFGG